MPKKDKPSNPSKRAFTNPVLAEAIRLAKERQKQAEAEKHQDDTNNTTRDTNGDNDTTENNKASSNPPASPPVKKSRWLDNDNDDDDDHDDDHQPAHKKQKHSSDTAAAPRSMIGLSAAERAQLEVEEFKRRQAELNAHLDKNNDDDDGNNNNIVESDDELDDLIDNAYNTIIANDKTNNTNSIHDNSSQQQNIIHDTTTNDNIKGGDVSLDSSPEEALHIRREAHSYHALKDEVDNNNTNDNNTIDDDGDDDDALLQGPQRPPSVGVAAYGYYNDDGTVEAYPEIEEDEDDNDHHHHTITITTTNDHNDNEQPHHIDDTDNNHNNNTTTTTTTTTTIKHRHMSMLNECRSVENYEKLNRISEGSYGVVYRARDKETGEICALKKVKLEKERDGFPLTSLREINVLLSLNHPSIVNVSEVVIGSTLDAVFMVMEYADHDLKSVMDRRMTQPFSIAEVKCLMLQLLSGIAYLHNQWVIHRDLKTSNVLYTNDGRLKICDFGLARQYGSPLKAYTHMVVTLWYRAPELLLGSRVYSTPVDVWSTGCIMAELLSRKPLFTGLNEMNQIDTIFKILGTPTEESWPGLSSLPVFKKFKFVGSPHSRLRERFPAPGVVFDGRPSLSESGFDLLCGLLEVCPVRID